MWGIRAARAARRRIAGRAAVVGSLAQRDEICEQPIRSGHAFRELAKPREAGVHEIALPMPGHEQAALKRVKRGQNAAKQIRRRPQDAVRNMQPGIGEGMKL